MQYAVKCDVPGCQNGYVNGLMCAKCEGNGSVVLGRVDTDQERAFEKFLVRVFAYVVFFGAVIGGAIWSVLLKKH